MAIKTIYLLRHGQYKSEPVEKLTSLGRKQAKFAGKRLKEIKFHQIHFSTMPRAKETAEIVLKSFSRRHKMHGSDHLRECIPGFPKKLRKKHGYTDLKKLRTNKLKANKAYKSIFQFSKLDRNELVVCHGNIIRYFLCKAMAIETDGWPKFDIKQCGLTVITLDSKSRSVKIVSHNDVGHIPLKLQTFI